MTNFVVESFNQLDSTARVGREGFSLIYNLCLDLLLTVIVALFKQLPSFSLRFYSNM